MPTIDLELPLGKRKPIYRFFEILPALLSYGAVILLIVLSVINPVLGSAYMLLIIITTLVKAAGIAYRTIGGNRAMRRAERVDWKNRLRHLSSPSEWYEKLKNDGEKSFSFTEHVSNLRRLSVAEPGFFPNPSEVWNAVIIATYNESLDTLKPTVESVRETTFDKTRMVLVIAYEERGGEEIEYNARCIKNLYKNDFAELILVKHPDGLKNEVVGKGANITYAGEELYKFFIQRDVKPSDVIVTTLDSDNRPHKSYFDYVTYEYIVHENRKHLAYQPVSLFTNNIWDAPAPVRVIATGNSFWNIISSMRPHSLRNFASHSQSLDALQEMGFWSKRTIVEDGHQYWRSYFYFEGDYAVLPIHVPVCQDAVLSYSFWKTLKAQFVQLRRWDYGASDVAYVATKLFSRNRNVPFFNGLAKLVRLIDSHITLASIALIVAFGGWVPLVLNPTSNRSLIAHQLPAIVSNIQMVAMVGLFITIILSIQTLPPRPAHYKRTKTLMMVLQWILMPITSILYSSAAAFYSQTRLALGLYMEKFDVTDKATKKIASDGDKN